MDRGPTEIYTLSLHDALPIYREISFGILSIFGAASPTREISVARPIRGWPPSIPIARRWSTSTIRSEEHTSELQSRGHLVCRLLLEKIYKQYSLALSFRVPHR